MAKPKAKPALTQWEVFGRLQRKYGETAGNGSAYVVLPEVRNASGFGPTRTRDADGNLSEPRTLRTIDGYIMSLWQSRGHDLIAVEIKSSRSDWLKELREGAKAEAFAVLADRFYIACGAKGIVHEGELPPTWGLMEPHGAGMRIVKEAPLLRQRSDHDELPPEFDRSFLAALLRAATRQAEVTPAEIREAVRAERESVQAMMNQRLELAEQGRDRAQDMLRRFEKEMGVRLGDDERPWTNVHTPEELAAAVKVILRGDHDMGTHVNRLRSLKRTVDELQSKLDDEIDRYDRKAADATT